MKMFEYMACGRAILSSDLPVLHEVLNDSNCIFCPPADVESWTKGLESVIEDPKMRNRLGLKCKQDVLEYTWVKRANKALAGFP
jgi:glycosyltransferase involved in cell wall biosynthesis